MLRTPLASSRCLGLLEEEKPSTHYETEYNTLLSYVLGFVVVYSTEDNKGFNSFQSLSSF